MLGFLRRWKCNGHLLVRIVGGESDQWCSKYIGKEIHVMPFINSQNQIVHFLWTVTKCRHNKAILQRDEWLNVKYENAWGITLSIRTENIEVIKGVF